MPCRRATRRRLSIAKVADQSTDRPLLLGVASIHAKARANPRTLTATTRMSAVCRKPSSISAIPQIYRYELRLVRLLAVHSSYKRIPMVTTKPDPITPAIKNRPIFHPVKVICTICRKLSYSPCGCQQSFKVEQRPSLGRNRAQSCCTCTVARCIELLKESFIPQCGKPRFQAFTYLSNHSSERRHASFAAASS